MHSLGCDAFGLQRLEEVLFALEHDYILYQHLQMFASDLSQQIATQSASPFCILLLGC